MDQEHIKVCCGGLLFSPQLHRYFQFDENDLLESNNSRLAAVN